MGTTRTERKRTVPNPFCHVELNTDDVAKAESFYAKLFAWKLGELGGPGPKYTMIDTGSRQVGGGITARAMKEAPVAWLSYVQVKSVKATLTKAKKLGARVVVPYQPVPGMGALGVFVDPTGAAIGVWQPKK
jgi:predicted enzyme related to lactoylglutathione lyase